MYGGEIYEIVLHDVLRGLLGCTLGTLVCEIKCACTLCLRRFCHTALKV